MANKNTTWGFVAGEYGGSGSWYIGVIEHSFAENFGVGLRAQMFAAHGVRFSFKPVKKLYIWACPGYSPQFNEITTTFGLRFTP